VNWRWISIASLLAALVVGYGALVRRDSVETTLGEAPPQPGYYLRDAVITDMQADGTLGLRLVAKQIQQQTTEESVILHAVRVDYLKVPDRPWTLTADEATIPPSTRIVQFSGNVQLRPADVPAESFLRAEALALDTEKNRAYSTSSPVTVKLGPNTMKVKGFSADLTNEKVVLEAVSGRLEHSAQKR
jgi:LPS export ABC transporter protein LptC